MFRQGNVRLRLLIYVVLVIVLIGAIAWGVSSWMSPVVNVTQMTRGPVVQAFYATGTVRPVREYPIRTPLEGTLDKVLVDKGSAVQKGQTLAIVHDPAIQFRLDRAVAVLEEKTKLASESTSPVIAELDAKIKASEELNKISQREVARITQMSTTSAASMVDLDRALDQLQTRISTLESLKAQRATKLLELAREKQVAQAEFDKATWDVEQQTLKSPIDGVVLDRPTSQGTRVAINDTLMRVADVRASELVMRAQVDEEDVTHCRIGQIVRMSLYAFPGEPITGKVVRIYNEADRDRRTFEVDVSFDQASEKLSAGMTGELAFIISEKESADVLPATAFQNGAIYIVRDGKLIRTDAKIGLSSFERIEVLSGIAPTDQVLISPIGSIAPDARVSTQTVDPDEAVGIIRKDAKAAEGTPFKGFN